jgi:hypothetical protein
MLKKNICCRLIDIDFVSDFGIVSPLECRDIENIQQNMLREQNKDLVSCYLPVYADDCNTYIGRKRTYCKEKHNLK